jgi:phospholipase C
VADLSSIEHVILLCMENRSFDHYLGALSLPPLSRDDVDGLRIPPRSVPDSNGQPVPGWQIDGSDPPVGPDFPDVPHGKNAMLADWNAGKNDGFVTTYQAAHAKDVAPLQPPRTNIPMGYYTDKTLPVLYALAQEFTVCDMWFASMLSSTWPNRKYLHSGRRDDDDDTQIFPGIRGFQTNPIYGFIERSCDRNNKPLTWKSYFSDLPFLAFWYGFAATHAFHNFSTIETFVDDCRENKLPSVSVIDPPFTLADDHPPHDPALGEKFIGLVVDALTNSPAWETSALVILYDECGGFYDHRPPPASGVPNDPDANLGFRVPALIVSPYALRGATHTQYDHTSFIKSLKELWNLPLDQERTNFGVRWPHANSFWDALNFAQKPRARGTYTGKPLSHVNWASGVRERLNTPLGQFEALLERIFILPELKTLDRRADVFDTLGKMEDNVVTVKRMQDYETAGMTGGGGEP